MDKRTAQPYNPRNPEEHTLPYAAVIVSDSAEERDSLKHWWEFTRAAPGDKW